MKIERLDNYRWKIPAEGGMNVPGLVFADEELLTAARADHTLQQVIHVAHLPGIINYSLAMPDMHWGYGFPIGGVAAFNLEEGVISPGGVGYDINCGVRLIGTALQTDDIKPKLKSLADRLYSDIPAGLGSAGALKLSKKELKKVLGDGASWAVHQGMGDQADLEHTEERGAMAGADPDAVSERALERGQDQLGTLGSGNHFIEIDAVDRIFDPKAAEAFGLSQGQVVLQIHSGSRGLGHQVCDDFLKSMMKSFKEKAMPPLPDRQLACAYLASGSGRAYFAAMAAAANFAWANRQVLMHLARKSFERVLGLPPRELRMRLIYDVAHNIAKKEKHTVEGRERMVCVHRKGATRAFPAGHPDLPADYSRVGQPVLIPGDMGRASFICAGEPGAMKESFGSCCHGAGRVLSRTAAKRDARGRSIAGELSARGIQLRASGRDTAAEEMPEAYKDVDRVVEVVHMAGLARKVARLKPLGVVKG